MEPTARIEIPEKLIPVFLGAADVRGSHGGRGSGKTRSFAKMSAVRAYMWGAEGREGIILCGRQFMNSLDESSLEEVKAAIRSEEWLAAYFDIGEKYIKTKDGRISYKFTGLDRNVDSVKSKARILLCWIDEAEPVTDEAWTKLIPTIRGEDSELWVTWNPERKGSSTDKRFRNSTDPLTKIVALNWRDNPKFPAILNRRRKRDSIERPEQYDHIWEGAYKTYVEGAYYAPHLLKAKEEGRIGRIPPDPLMAVRAYCDLGGTGARADAFAMWICQFVGKEIRILNYYEAQGQPLAEHLDWMRKNGYGPGKVEIFLPHDGLSEAGPIKCSWESEFSSAGYATETLRNEGSGRTGARSVRINATRRLFPAMYFNEETTKAGRDALGWYHEKKDEERNIGLGPEHDWASHGADAFGLMSVAYAPPQKPAEPIKYPKSGIV